MSAHRHRWAYSPATTTEKDRFKYSFDRSRLSAHSLIVDREHHQYCSATEGPVSEEYA